MNRLKRIEVVMEGGPVGPELQVVNMTDGPFYYADEADKRIAELEARGQIRESLIQMSKRHTEITKENASLKERIAELEKEKAWLRKINTINTQDAYKEGMQTARKEIDK